MHFLPSKQSQAKTLQRIKEKVEDVSMIYYRQRILHIVVDRTPTLGS